MLACGRWWQMVLMTNIMNSWCRYHHTFLCILMQAGGHHGNCNRKLRKAAGRPVSGSPTYKCHRKGVSLLQSGRSWQECMHMNPCQAILKHVCVWRQRAKWSTSTLLHYQHFLFRAGDNLYSDTFTVILWYFYRYNFPPLVVTRHFWKGWECLHPCS